MHLIPRVTHIVGGRTATRLVLPSLLFVLLLTDRAQAQFTSGGVYDGVISVSGGTDSWTFPASAGEKIVLRWTFLSGTNGFTARVRLHDPNGVLLHDSAANSVNEYAFTSGTNGTFTALVSDGTDGGGDTGTGTYRFHFAKLPGPFTIPPGDDGGAFPVSGGIVDGVIGQRGDMDLWTFPANVGEKIVFRWVRLSDTNGFLTNVRLYDPNGVLLLDGGATGVNEFAFTATNSGTFTLLVTARNGTVLSGTGTYRFHFAKLPGPFIIPPGDDGGSFPGSGGQANGAISQPGDMDLWTFPANTGEKIMFRWTRLSSTNSFLVTARLYDPNGLLLLDATANTVSDYSFTATNNGTFTLLVSAKNGTSLDGTGLYQFNFLKLPGEVVVSPGDEGGQMTNGVGFIGTIATGDIDVWSFNACSGDGFTLQLDELTGGAALLPQMRLYGRDGTLLNTASGQTNALISRSASASGTYTLVVGDSSGSLTGTGTYRLIATGISSGLTFCHLVRTGSNVLLHAVGGKANATSVLLTTTNVARSRALWTPVLTNSFDGYGVFSSTNSRDGSTTAEYFLLLQP